ncbi:Os10g0520502 [Oryza sativa Japonica Group]|uniref:Os10g0520502 protein n=1 Tax=Oryza sativa subsp. japonica TaxID=39947 RepID=A0A0N7KS33_ORYSJ|nr:Os10g0520502 [Oryza sativa Japonica Group]
MGDHTDIHGPAAGASTVHGSASKATSNHVFSSAGTAAIKTFKTNDGTAYYEVQPKIESSAEVKEYMEANFAYLMPELLLLIAYLSSGFPS